MRAAVIHEFGAPEVLRIEDVPEPVRARGEALVRVHAVRVGGLLDVGTRAGHNHFARLTFPHILGSDFAGEVVEVDADETRVRPGDRVAGIPHTPCGRCRACLAGREDACPTGEIIGVHRQGSYAELVAAPVDVLSRLPEGMSYVQGAAIAVSGPVAYTQFDVAGLREGDWTLVTAAASGLGLVTAQVAKLLGARVIATSRKDWKREELRRLGMDAVLDSDAPDFVAQVADLTAGEGVQVAVDNTSSAALFERELAVLGRLGVIVSSGALRAEPVTVDMRRLYTMSQSVIGIRTHTRAGIEGFWRLVDAGFETIVDRTFALEEAAAAHHFVEGEQNFGRVLLTPGPAPRR
ncbi:MAG: zinc-binding dehydrogenase [Candidatus Dormibacteraeota bacterium]|nr:zinc-binding dehydrogenase [Candidatus Dormibacteraeota bacterium]